MACLPILTILTHSGTVLTGKFFSNNVQSPWSGHKMIKHAHGTVEKQDSSSPRENKKTASSSFSLAVITPPTTTQMIFTSTSTSTLAPSEFFDRMR
jgi:hypothetical protein